MKGGSTGKRFGEAPSLHSVFPGVGFQGQHCSDAVEGWGGGSRALLRILLRRGELGHRSELPRINIS